MKKRSFVTHILLAVVLLAGMAIIVGYGLNSWWRVAAVAVAIGVTGSWVRYLTIGGIIGVVGTLTIALPIGMLMAMSYYYDDRAAFTEHIDVLGWLQVFAPTVTGVAVVWLSRRLLSVRP